MENGIIKHIIQVGKGSISVYKDYIVVEVDHTQATLLIPKERIELLSVNSDYAGYTDVMGRLTIFWGYEEEDNDNQESTEQREDSGQDLD